MVEGDSLCLLDARICLLQIPHWLPVIAAFCVVIGKLLSLSMPLDARYFAFGLEYVLNPTPFIYE